MRNRFHKTGNFMSERMDIKTFAKAVGVSAATVSRAFGGVGRISEETRRKVLEAAEKMGSFMVQAM